MTIDLDHHDAKYSSLDQGTPCNCYRSRRAQERHGAAILV